MLPWFILISLFLLMYAHDFNVAMVQIDPCWSISIVMYVCRSFIFIPVDVCSWPQCCYDSTRSPLIHIMFVVLSSLIPFLFSFLLMYSYGINAVMVPFDPHWSIYTWSWRNGLHPFTGILTIVYSWPWCSLFYVDPRLAVLAK